MNWSSMTHELTLDEAEVVGAELIKAELAMPAQFLAVDAPVVDLRPPPAATAPAGVQLDDEGLSETPARMARAYAELIGPKPLRLTTFPNTEGYDELVIARGIPFRTVCEHHLLPFSGVAQVGYLPGRKLRNGSPSRSPTSCSNAYTRSVPGSCLKPSTPA